MTDSDIVRHRLRHQQLATQQFPEPEALVRWFGAVQAQDYNAACWALGQRLTDGTVDRIEQAFDAGALLRTHVMRPTWHFVSPADIRWMVALSAPRLSRILTYYLRASGLDAAALRRSRAALERALRGGHHLTRAELMPVLRQARLIDASRPEASQILGHVLVSAEVHGLVCSGRRRGKQFTYALLEERVPPAREYTREEALAELARRYFTSHGPATLKDFVWWSGLSATDARAGLESVKSDLRRFDRDGLSYWLPASASSPGRSRRRALLISNFDEYMVGYTNRSAVVDPSRTPDVSPRTPILLGQTILIDGIVVATWKRTLGRTGITVDLQPLAVLTEEEEQAVAAAVDRFGRFAGQPASLVAPRPIIRGSAGSGRQSSSRRRAG